MHVVEHEADDPDAAVIVLVHGLFDSGASFDGVVAELTPEFTVVTYDRRGWGQSRDDEPPESLADHARDTLAVMRERRATVVGHSYGGAVALMAAYLRPDLVAALAVFEPTVAWTDWWPTYDEMMERSAELRAMFSRWNEGAPRRTPEARIADEVSSARDLPFVAEAPFELADLAVPRLVGGSIDTTPWDYESAERLADVLDADLVVFADAGHTAHRTHPSEFADFARRAAALARPR